MQGAGTMAKITRVEALVANLVPKVKRTDATQTFVSQETPIIRIYDADGAVGTGYSYTIGMGGPSIMKLIELTLAPALIGREAAEIERIWRDLLFLTHATSVGAITSLALAAVDTALWDLIPIARSIDLSAPCVGCLPLFHRASQSGRLTSSPRFLSFAWQAFVGRAGLTSAVRTARGHGIIECPGVEAYSCIDFFPSRKRMGLAGSSISAAPEPNPDTLPPADA